MSYRSFNYCIFSFNIFKSCLCLASVMFFIEILIFSYFFLILKNTMNLPDISFWLSFIKLYARNDVTNEIKVIGRHGPLKKCFTMFSLNTIF